MLDLEYFLELLLGGLTRGSIYALIALGYTMVYGIIPLRMPRQVTVPGVMPIRGRRQVTTWIRIRAGLVRRHLSARVLKKAGQWITV